MRYYLYLVALAVFLCSLYGRAEDIVELNEVSLDYARYKQDGRDPFLGEPPKEGLNININMNILTYGYFRNTVHSYTDNGGFRAVGWEYTLGIHTFEWLDVYARHYSRHILDKDDPSYPVENSIGIKVYLFKGEKHLDHSTLF